MTNPLPLIRVDLGSGEAVSTASFHLVRVPVFGVTITALSQPVEIRSITFPWLERRPMEPGEEFNVETYPWPGEVVSDNVADPDGTVLQPGETRTWNCAITPLEKPRSIRADVTLASGEVVSSGTILWRRIDTSGSPLDEQFPWSAAAPLGTLDD